MFANVVFPLRLPALTYRLVPPLPDDLPGRIVRAPLLDRVMNGVIVEVFDEVRVEEHAARRPRDIRSVESIHERFAEGPALKLMTWLSDYYLAPAGLALKVMFFEETLAALARLGKAPAAPEREQPLQDMTPRPAGPTAAPVHSQDMCLIAACTARRDYRTFLVTAGGAGDDLGTLAALRDIAASAARNLLVLVPEIRLLTAALPPLKEMFGDRLALLHSKLPRTRRIDTLGRIVSREIDVVLGTRSAVFAPLREVSLIVVLSEHSPSYKAEEGLRYHGRDVAVMRGFIERSPVVLSSSCPSLESLHNVATGKYRELRLTVDAGAALQGGRNSAASPGAEPSSPHYVSMPLRHRPAHPAIALTVVRHFRRDGPLSPQVLSRTKRLLASGEAVLFLSSRKGYALLRCEECGHAFLCDGCRVPMVLYKASRLMRCHHCRREERPPDRCPRCAGFRIQPVQSGAEKVREFIEDTFGMDVRLVERSKGTRPSPFEVDEALLSPVVVATAQAGRTLSHRSLGAAVFLDADALLSRPFFRAGERTFQDVLQVAHLVKPGGAVFIQTAVPGLPLFRRLKSLDYAGFAQDELAQRKVLGYPPYSRIVLLTLSATRSSGAALTAVYEGRDNGAVEVIGPLPKEPPDRRCAWTHQIILRSADREALHVSARDLLRGLAALKGLKVTVDVDPSEI